MRELLILSGKGGTGKTTIANAFIHLSKAKVYADCDIDAPNLHLVLRKHKKFKTKDYFGLKKADIDYNLCTQCGLCYENCNFNAISYNGNYKVDYYSCEGCGVCTKICSLKAIYLKDSVSGELKLSKEECVFSTAKLKMGNGNSGMLVTEVKKQMRRESKYNEIAVIDGSPGIGCPIIASLSGVYMVLIVAEPSVSGISDMKRIVELALKFHVEIAVCINKYDLNNLKTDKIIEYCKDMKLVFVGKIPYEKNISDSNNLGGFNVNSSSLSGDAVKYVFRKSMEILMAKE